MSPTVSPENIEPRAVPVACGPVALAAGGRIAWVEIAKGICAVLVVLMHATFSLESALGRSSVLHAVSDFAQPVRMPVFFALSGLFLARSLAADWRTFLYRRVYHYLYFYAVWLPICSASKFAKVSDGSMLGFAKHLLWSCVEPYSTLWFIYALAAFSLLTRLLIRFPVAWVLPGALALATWPIQGGGYLLSISCRYYVFFLVGYLFSAAIRAAGQEMRRHLCGALAVVAGWTALNAAAVFPDVLAPVAAPLAALPPVEVCLGLAGLMGVIALAGLADRTPLGRLLAYVGEHSIILYLVSFVPVAVAREFVVRLIPAADVGIASLAVAAFGIAGSLLTERALRGTPAALLFTRPAARLGDAHASSGLREPASAAAFWRPGRRSDAGMRRPEVRPWSHPWADRGRRPSRWAKGTARTAPPADRGAHAGGRAFAPDRERLPA